MTDTPEQVGWMPTRAYDKTGRRIEVGDVLKVFHFMGGRWRKKHYMYKQVIGTRIFGDSGIEYLLVSHLNLTAWEHRDGGYTLAQDGTTYQDTEIVQGIDWYHDRPRVVPPSGD